MTNEERIKADAINYSNTSEAEFSQRSVSAYIAGATAEQSHMQPVIDAAEKVAKIFAHKGDHQTCAICQLARALEQWRGKEPDRPCSHCGKELSRDRNLCCRECGKEVEQVATICKLSTEEKKKLLANKIEARMKEVGLQRQELADLMGTQPSTITRWLSGEHNFQIDTLFEIEKQLNIKLFNL